MALQKCFSRRAALLYRNNEMRFARVLVTAATLLCDNAFGSRYFLDGSDEIRLFEACGGAGGRADEPSDTDRPNHRQCPFGSWNRVSNSLHGRRRVWLSLESRSLEGLKIHFLFSPMVFEDLLGFWRRRRGGVLGSISPSFNSTNKRYPPGPSERRVYIGVSLLVNPDHASHQELWQLK